MKTNRCHYISHFDKKRCQNQGKFKVNGTVFTELAIPLDACEEHYGDLVKYPQIFYLAAKTAKRLPKTNEEILKEENVRLKTIVKDLKRRLFILRDVEFGKENNVTYHS